MNGLLVVCEKEILVEQAEDIEILAVAEQGPPGIQGPPGGGAGATYTHTQSSLATVWTIAHNLGRYPSITVVDNLGGQLYPDVRYLDADIVQITHSVPLTGRAFCN
ncbi:hypothetical protein A4F85_01895 [Delftia sp. GW456-R20]|uniref:hypothetical protein n=1 Tax=Delftia sp. GW456-R20 TaxID=1827145 RepID=UPI0007AEA637|nr:hypothetical protein [Delftia sp. GW456-R20]KZK31513.1 hypothetical protein A4F85_01895 [Delftia sp. GW456-R20]